MNFFNTPRPRAGNDTKRDSLNQKIQSKLQGKEVKTQVSPDRERKYAHHLDNSLYPKSNIFSNSNPQSRTSGIVACSSMQNQEKETRLMQQKMERPILTITIDGKRYNARHVCWHVKKVIQAKQKIITKRIGREIVFYCNGQPVATLYNGDLMNFSTGEKILMGKKKQGICNNRKILKLIAHSFDIGNVEEFNMKSEEDQIRQVIIGEGSYISVFTCDFSQKVDGKFKTIHIPIDRNVIEYCINYSSGVPKLPMKPKYAELDADLRNEINSALIDSAGSEIRIRGSSLLTHDELISDAEKLDSFLRNEFLRLEIPLHKAVESKVEDPISEDPTLADSCNVSMDEEFAKQFGHLFTEKKESGFGELNEHGIMQTLNQFRNQSRIKSDRSRKFRNSMPEFNSKDSYEKAEISGQSQRKLHRRNNLGTPANLIPSSKSDSKRTVEKTIESYHKLAKDMIDSYNLVENYDEDPHEDVMPTHEMVDWLRTADIEKLQRFTSFARNCVDGSFVVMAEAILRNRESTSDSKKLVAAI